MSYELVRWARLLWGGGGLNNSTHTHSTVKKQKFTETKAEQEKGEDCVRRRRDASFYIKKNKGWFIDKYHRICGGRGLRFFCSLSLYNMQLPQDPWPVSRNPCADVWVAHAQWLGVIIIILISNPAVKAWTDAEINTSTRHLKKYLFKHFFLKLVFKLPPSFYCSSPYLAELLFCAFFCFPSSVCASQQAPAAHLCRPWPGRQDLRLFPVSTEVLFPDRTTGKTLDCPFRTPNCVLDQVGCVPLEAHIRSQSLFPFCRMSVLISSREV